MSLAAASLAAASGIDDEDLQDNIELLKRRVALLEAMAPEPESSEARQPNNKHQSLTGHWLVICLAGWLAVGFGWVGLFEVVWLADWPRADRHQGLRVICRLGRPLFEPRSCT